MSTEIVPRLSGLTKRDLPESRLYPNIKTPAQGAVVLAKARSFGVCPTVVAENLFFVGGKPSLSAHLIATLVKRSGRYDYRVVEKTDKHCVIDFFEVMPAGREKIGRETFTWAMAQRAGLASGVNWRKYPEAMLWARCLTAGVRAHCPDALGGTPVYSVEELSPTTEVDSEGRPMLAASDDTQDAEVVEPTEQHQQIEQLLADTGTDRERFLTHYGAASVTSLEADACTQAIATLTAKKQAQHL